jgi:acyl-ACP thioesterase
VVSGEQPGTGGERGGEEFAELVSAPRGGRVFERETLPGLADATGSGRVRLDAIARWLQDVAYADLVSAGLAGRGAWVVRRARIRVESFPRFGEAVSLSTFCSGWGPLVAERRTSISGNDGSVEAVALWVHLDPSTLRPARLGEEFHAVYDESAGGRRVRSRLRHPGPPADPVRAHWHFRASDVDVAGHVNNAAYWAPVEELYAEAPEPEAADVEIEFREPGQPGDATLLREGAAMWVEDGRGALLASMLGLPSPRSG